MENFLTESDWENFSQYNTPNGLPFGEFLRADRARCQRLSARTEIRRAIAAGKRQIFSKNLAAANCICREVGLPELSIGKALRYYGTGGHNYCPTAPDRGANDAGAGSPSWYAAWRVTLALHEGNGAENCAAEAQNAAFGEFCAAREALEPLEERISALVGVHED